MQFALSSSVAGAELHLSGTESLIKFGDGHQTAQLYARCAGSNPALEWISPTSALFDQTSKEVTAWMSGLDPECTHARSPCISSNPEFPPYFYCVWTGATNSLVLGPLHANKTAGADGSWLYYLTCPLPTSTEAMEQVRGNYSQGATLPLVLSVKHFVPRSANEHIDNATAFEWKGAWQGDSIHVTLPGPPPSPSSPSPLAPPPPPSVPGGNLHRTTIMNIYSCMFRVTPTTNKMSSYCAAGTDSDSFAQSLEVKHIGGQHVRKLLVTTMDGTLYYWPDFTAPSTKETVDLGGLVEMSAPSHYGACGLLQSGSVRCWKFGGVGEYHSAGSSMSGPDVNFGSGVKVTTLAARGDGAMCALVDASSSCASRIMCWGQNNGGATPSCLDLSATADFGVEAASVKKSFTTSTSGVHGVELKGGWTLCEYWLLSLALPTPCVRRSLPQTPPCQASHPHPQPPTASPLARSSAPPTLRQAACYHLPTDLTYPWPPSAVCALLINHQVACWGGGQGVTGLPTTLSNAAQISVQGNSGCILPKPLGSGRAECWGSGANFGTTSPVPTSFNPVYSTSQGYSVCFVSSDDTVECMGSGTMGTVPTPGSPSTAKVRSAG